MAIDTADLPFAARSSRRQISCCVIPGCSIYQGPRTRVYQRLIVRRCAAAGGVVELTFASVVPLAVMAQVVSRFRDIQPPPRRIRWIGRIFAYPQIASSHRS